MSHSTTKENGARVDAKDALQQGNLTPARPFGSFTYVLWDTGVPSLSKEMATDVLPGLVFLSNFVLHSFLVLYGSVSIHSICINIGDIR